MIPGCATITVLIYKIITIGWFEHQSFKISDSVLLCTWRQENYHWLKKHFNKVLRLKWPFNMGVPSFWRVLNLTATLKHSHIQGGFHIARDTTQLSYSTNMFKLGWIDTNYRLSIATASIRVVSFIIHTLWLLPILAPYWETHALTLSDLIYELYFYQTNYHMGCQAI